jgi:hypothetical protein
MHLQPHKFGFHTQLSPPIHPAVGFLGTYRCTSKLAVGCALDLAVLIVSA